MDDTKDPIETTAAGSFEESPHAPSVALPAQIGRYRVIRSLGQGGFGRVFLAHDVDIDRRVAIKVPSPERISRAEDAEAFLAEARVVAQLDHPHIVPVYDVGRTEDGLCYVVSRYVEGSDLAARIRQGCLQPRESAELAAVVAEALHHAHARGLVHRDIKPANILIETTGKPFVADFGLALKDEDFGRGEGFAGTPAYMSPEQARGEGHLVDGRSDIFSLGVVLYELLTGRRPFRGKSFAEILEQIRSADVRPPRMIDDTIPKELERICLKAMSRRAPERYNTATDMAEDLRLFLQTECGTAAPGSSPEAPPLPPTSRQTGSDQRPVRIVPKGLRSFDEHDADFFLELVPGPRDRDGLPESIRFWKTRIEEVDEEKTFRVGLIYGPSGCGKSSLLRAGLLPRLGKQVVPVYIEATADETEARLLRAIRKACPDLAADRDLVETLAILRRGRVLRSSRKLLLVIDQFEQWLHSRRGEEDTELVAALRHCDGEHLQAIVLVRDDFWLAVSRFMAGLEVELLQGQNVLLVDLFDPRHARKVLRAFGQAYGTLPEDAGGLTRDQDAFLDRAILGLAQDNKVISVRLTLFAELVKGMPWTPVALRDVGGTEGVRITFLEETFSSGQANPKHRLHQQAARAVLKALLPESGTDIKGQMRSESALQEASGYGSRPRDFTELIHILDGELRLITPTDPEGVAGDEGRVAGEQGRVAGHEGRVAGENTDDRAALPTAGSVTVRHGIGGEVLSGDQGLPKRGAVWADKSNPTVGDVDPGKHRRGTGEGAHQGIPQPSEHRSRIAERAGNAPDAQPAGRAAATGGTRELVGAERSHQPDAQRPTQSAGKTPGNLTMTDPATCHSPPGTRHSPPATRYYQLTHDYLVPSLRDWLTRKQRETRRGRAELRLAERAALWNARPENRHLPSVMEWANIGLLTRRKDWNELQHRMMKKAGRVHGVRGFLVLLLLAAANFTGLVVYNRVNEDRQATHAAGLVTLLLNADTAQVREIISVMRGYRQWVDPLLWAAFGKAAEGSPQRLHASLGLLPVDPGQADYLSNRLLNASPSELPVIWRILKDHGQAQVDRFWAKVEDPRADPDQQFRAACALANSDAAQAEKSWESVAPFVADRFLTAVIKNPADYSPLIKTLRPIRKRLLTPLASIFQNTGRSESASNFATTILADYAADNPDVLAELVMVADPKAYLTFFPLAERHAEKTLPVFQAEIAKKATYSWGDTPLDPSWAEPDPALLSRIESSQGMVADRFAFCQTMPLEEFSTLAEGLRKSGYRPVRFRPWADGQVVNVAAVWTRDGRSWRLKSGLTAEQTRQQDDKNRSEKFLPVDVAGYVAAGGDGKPADRYAVVWVEKSGDDDARMDIGRTTDEQSEVQSRMKEAKLIPRTLHALRGPDGRTTYCGVWGRHSAGESSRHSHWAQSEASFRQHPAREGEWNLIDVAVSGEEPPRTARERAQASQESAERSLKAKPDDLNARFARATAFIQLGEDRKALNDLEVLIEKAPQFGNARQYRAMVHARLGQKKEALDYLAKFQKGDATESSKLYLAVVLAAEIGEGVDRAFERLESALKKAPHDQGLHYDAACAYALASKALARSDRARSARHAEQAVRLLETAVKNGYFDYDHIEEDADLDPVRDLPAFAELMRAGHPDRRYAALWSSDSRFESTTSHGLDPAAHLGRCRDLMAQGYRPVSLSAVRTSPDGSLVTASVWHRPSVSEKSKDDLAERQARAAAALARLGHGEQVWPLLRHSPDPRLRSFIVNWLSLLGTDPGLIAAEFDRLNSPTPPHPPPTTQKMDAILFHPETSMRRALILALGTYGANGLSPGERAPLIAKLFDLYEYDPDAGIHGAAEWTLRHWKQDEKLKAAQEGLSQLKDKGARRWFVNSQGQTFAKIDGPVEFHMGSPPTEPDRDEDETPHPRVIARRFAIADKEVTVEQYQQFARENPHFAVAQSFLDKCSPDPNGPMVGVSWFGAAAYCNWLSKKEGVPRDQWCYLPNEREEFDAGMMIPANAFQRTGYRLPAESEWEYACRAGTVTSRYHGLSVGLLDAYARYAANSTEHAWPGGGLQPNDLGLFDMLGNVYEWCQERQQNYQPGGIESIHDDILDIRNYRLLRGGAFYSRPAGVRSAYRGRLAPSDRGPNYGFRLARTNN